MNKRIIGFDIARALAVLGMILVNFKIVLGAETNGPAWLQQLNGLLDGRAAATFVVLAGVGISLLSRQGRVTQDISRIARDRNTLLKRALFLFVVGLLYTPIWPADILHFYGVYIAVAAFLLTATNKQIASIIAGLILGFSIALFVFDYEIGWNWDTLEYSGFWSVAGMARHIMFNGFHPVIPWLAFLLLGMIIGRTDMRTRSTRRRVLLLGGGIALFAELASWGLIAGTEGWMKGPAAEEVAALFGTAPMPPMPLYMLAGAGTACVLISLCVSLGEHHPNSKVLQPLVSTGQLALTLYVAHVILGMGTLEAVGRVEDQSLWFATIAAFVFFGTSILFSHLWLKKYRRGPLEMIMRKMT